MSSSTVWTRRGSPYVLKGDVTVAWGTRLTIEPGVQVIAASQDALRAGVDPQRVELIIDGTLVVKGTEQRPVEFTSQGERGSWYGLRVRGGRGTVIDGAILTQASQGISLDMSAVVRNTSVSALAKDCLRVSWGTATLEDNRLSGCGLHPSPSSSHPSRVSGVDSVTRPDGSTSERIVLSEAKVRGRAVFATRSIHRSVVAVTRVTWRPLRHPELVAAAGGGTRSPLPPPEDIQSPRPPGDRPPLMASGLPSHPALAAIPLSHLAEAAPGRLLPGVQQEPPTLRDRARPVPIDGCLREPRECGWTGAG
ncbi:MAG TPA: hypothetical protein VF794_10885 [Archangium sp.]|uniref:hypothetical protein n=1 Tax=Archangium sp. TaxID=1872627 RepID=UPI002ED9E085